MSYEITLLLCKCCFDVILEDDAEYLGDNCYCHHCIPALTFRKRNTATSQGVLCNFCVNMLGKLHKKAELEGKL